ncbi:MAG: fasciclin domain-containing protein [Pseudomonadota bacterium]
MTNLKFALAGATMLTAVAATTASADILNKDIFDETATIAENAQATSSFQTLVTAAQAAGLVDDLMGEGPFTVFAPTDDAFAALPEGAVEDLLMPENRDMLVDLLQAHIVPVRIEANDINAAFVGADNLSDTDAGAADLTLVEGEDIILADTLSNKSDLAIEKVGGSLYAYSVDENLNDDFVRGDIRIVGTDIFSSNGVIHIIDGVLMPQS